MIKNKCVISSNTINAINLYSEDALLRLVHTGTVCAYVYHQRISYTSDIHWP